MSAQQKPVPATSWLLPALGHALIILGMMMRVIVYVPRQKRDFDQYNMALPAISQWVIAASMWLAVYWWALAAAGLLLIVANAVVLCRLGGTRRRPGWLWSFGVGGGLLSLWVMLELAILLPMMKLAEAIGHEP